MEVTKEITKYVNQVRQWIGPFLKEKPREITTHRCALSIIGKELFLVHINYSQDLIEIVQTDKINFDTFDNVPLVLSGLISKFKLDTIPTYWLASPDDYQFLILDALPVTQEEFREALNWRIRAMLSFPIEEAIVDYFSIPGKKANPNQPMIAVVAARAMAISKIVNILNKSNVYLTTIDIPELALRNLSALFEQDEKPSALIYFYDNMVMLNVTCQKILYFSRRIPLNIDPQTKQYNYEQLCLDILRYFDYFQSQWRLPTPSRVLVASEKSNTPDIAKKLSEYLLVAVEPFPLNKFIIANDQSKKMEEKYLLSIGCALRNEISYAKSRN